jgi:hypothetical protein
MSAYKVKKCKKCEIRPDVEEEETGWYVLSCCSCGKEASGPTFLSAVECWNELANAED